MNCANCKNSKQRLHFLGWRLYCRHCARDKAMRDTLTGDLFA